MRDAECISEVQILHPALKGDTDEHSFTLSFTLPPLQAPAGVVPSNAPNSAVTAVGQGAPEGDADCARDHSCATGARGQRSQKRQKRQ